MKIRHTLIEEVIWFRYENKRLYKYHDIYPIIRRSTSVFHKNGIYKIGGFKYFDDPYEIIFQKMFK